MATSTLITERAAQQVGQLRGQINSQRNGQPGPRGMGKKSQPDAKPDHLRHLMNEIRESPTAYAPWNLKLKTPDLLMNPLQAWVEEKNLDIEYHVRRSALPSPMRRLWLRRI